MQREQVIKHSKSVGLGNQKSALKYFEVIFPVRLLWPSVGYLLHLCFAVETKDIILQRR